MHESVYVCLIKSETEVASDSHPIPPCTADSSMILSQEAVIGVTIVGSVVGTVALVLAIIGCFYCIRRCKTGGGKKYCTAGEKSRNGL